MIAQGVAWLILYAWSTFLSAAAEGPYIEFNHYDIRTTHVAFWRPGQMSLDALRKIGQWTVQT